MPTEIFSESRRDMVCTARWCVLAVSECTAGKVVLSGHVKEIGQ